jgi:2-polyprenyl-3-methyl-5-hydroxy-6-metoxy-1,4-benzoquinol methylase
MEANAFVAEVYRRMALRHNPDRTEPGWSEIENHPTVIRTARECAALLPASKDAAILDIGFGKGWFIAACLKLGYRDLSGADFGLANKAYVQKWAPQAITLHEISTDIGDFLAGQPQQYDFIHMSHVIEHIPKHSLLWVTDALYNALKVRGVLLLRTPNMEGPCAESSLYVTMAHEYGFAGSNLSSLMDICGFDDIRVVQLNAPALNLKERLGAALRLLYLKESQVRHRLFGANYGGSFGSELVITAQRGNFEPLFDFKYR